MIIRSVIAALFVLLTSGVSAMAQTATFDRAPLDVVIADGKRLHFTVEMAKTQEQLAQGLMFRKSLAADAGMLFDFGESRPVSMWMKNTLIPLDMLFMDRKGTIIHVEEFAVPGTLTPRGPSEPVAAVLELAGGTARRHHIHPGDHIEHPLFRRAP